MTITPMSIKRARRVVAEWHRHNLAPNGGLFAVGCSHNGELVGVAIVGRPVARLLDDGFSAEVTRVATNGARNACSALYGACLRACKALGYVRVFTYTLISEPGSSLLASGFVRDFVQESAESWNRPSRHRYEVDLFGNAQRPDEPKVRWVARFGNAT